VGVLERGQAITAGLKRDVRKLTRFSTSTRTDHRRVFRSQPTGRPARPSDETSDVRWACADELAADIFTEVIGAGQPFASTTASTCSNSEAFCEHGRSGPHS
jgi:hypothetical protein